MGDDAASPALVGISHGTSSDEGRRAVRAPARRRGRGDRAAASGCPAVGAARTRRRRAARRARHPRLARTGRARGRRAAAPLGGLPRVRRPHRGRRGGRPTARGRARGRPRARRPARGGAAAAPRRGRPARRRPHRARRRRARATGARSTTAATWPPGSPRHPLATCRWGSSRRPSRACPTRSPQPDRMPPPTAAGSWWRTTCSRPASSTTSPGRRAPTSRRARCSCPDAPAPGELVDLVLDRYDAAAAALG